MCLANSGVPHKQKSSLVTARIVTDEGLSKKLGSLQGLSLLRCVSLSVGKVSNVALKIAMFVALRNSRALHHAGRAILHPAIACHRAGAGRAIRSRYQLPSRSPAKRAIFQRHFCSV